MLWDLEVIFRGSGNSMEKEPKRAKHMVESHAVAAVTAVHVVTCMSHDMVAPWQLQK